MGELARQPDAPSLLHHPAELLEPKPVDFFYGLHKKYMPALFGAFVGCTVVTLQNSIARRPAYAGIHRHVFWSVVVWFFADRVRKIQREYSVEEYAIRKHYMELHPEDFPPIERKRIKELFEPWKPIR